MMTILVQSHRNSPKRHLKNSPTVTAKLFQANQNSQYKIIKKYRRNDLYFTQGLSFLNESTLLESSGLHGQSVLQIVTVEGVQTISQEKLQNTYFGEGSDFLKDDGKIFLLTWKERKVFIYNESLELQQTLDLPSQISEGWGMTHYKDENNKNTIVMSDGSNKLYYINPDNFEIMRTVSVFYENGNSLRYLNELEYYKGSILANVWMKNYIVRLDALTGNLQATYDLSDITKDMEQTESFENYSTRVRDYCLNGIAYYEPTNTLIVTGKKWPWLYQIEFLEN